MIVSCFENCRVRVLFGNPRFQYCLPVKKFFCICDFRCAIYSPREFVIMVLLAKGIMFILFDIILKPVIIWYITIFAAGIFKTILLLWIGLATSWRILNAKFRFFVLGRLLILKLKCWWGRLNRVIARLVPLTLFINFFHGVFFKWRAETFLAFAASQRHGVLPIIIHNQVLPQCNDAVRKSCFL